MTTARSSLAWLGQASAPGWQFTTGVVAFPTDTVYGLGCQVEDEDAIETIYRLKGRDETKPLILMGHTVDVLRPFVEIIPPLAEQLMADYWPGALTLVLGKSARVPLGITRGGQTVGCRVPDCPVLLDFLKTVPGGVLATTSANQSGEPALTQAALVSASFASALNEGLLVGLLADDTAIQGGVPSTVAGVDDHNRLRVFRQGGVDLSVFLTASS
jgi:L-threonylcarbamoyladenylate synthase